MSRYWPMVFMLAASWGVSYVFIKVAVEDIEPAPMMATRALLAGLLLFTYLAVTMGSRRAARALRTHWRPAVVLGALNAAVPFWLVAWGEKHIDSSIAGIAQATVAIFTFLLAARFLPHESVGLTRILGVAVGFVGVAVLAGFDPAGGWIAVAGTLAVVLSSLSYAASGVYGQLRVQTVPGAVLATGSMLAGGLILLPLALFQLPTHVPGAEAIGSLLALTILGTTFAQLLLFRLLRLYGSRRVSLVTYLIPGFALFYGAVLLDEPITVAALGGLVLILGGVALASGQQILQSRADAREEPACR
ncbi:MAG: DMT family transporter [Actinomycetota bacterium]|nr:DMT family transporter [Actinomycetota bacterium]